MSAYAIEKRGSDFVVKAGQQDILKFATKRQALQMIRDACSRKPIAPVLATDAHVGA